MSTNAAIFTPPTTSRWVTQMLQVLKRWLIVTWRQVWGPVMSLLQPILWILLFGQVFQSLGALPQFGGTGYVTYLVPGILMMTVLYSGAWAGTGYIDDMASGVLDQLLTAPVSRSAIITGQLLQQLIINLVQSLVVLGIGLLAGARYAGGAGGVIVALIVATLLASVFCSLSVAVALAARSQIALISISQMVVLPATFLSTTMMTADLMPEWVRTVAGGNPMTWAVESARMSLTGNFADIVWWHIAALGLLAALAFLLAVFSIRSYQRSL